MGVDPRRLSGAAASTGRAPLWARTIAMRKISDDRVGRQSHSANGVNGGIQVVTPEIRAALGVAQRYPVFPCALIPGPNGKSQKKPLVSDWPNVATRDAEIVIGWWRRYPNAYVGVPMGTASGLVAVDCDPAGRNWYWKHRDRLGTYRLHSTQRGKHLLYVYPDGAEVRNSGGQIALGVDVRGEGGFLLWWPAHGGVAIGEPGEMPGWLLEATKAQKVTNGKLNRHAAQDTDWEGERSRVIQALAQLDPDCGYGAWQEIASAISHECGGSEDGEDVFVCFSRGDYWKHKANTFPGENTVRKKYRSFKNRKSRNITLATLYQMVKDNKGTVPKGRPEKKANSKVVLARADTVEETSIDWLWKGFLARNKLHLLSGAGGSMKSTLTLTLAATVSTGGKWPDGTRAPQGNVIIWTGEDDLSDTVKPRLRFAGADLTRCYFVDGVEEEGKKRSFDPSRDVDKLAQACMNIGEVSLIIIDPAISVVQRDSNSAAEVRRGLDPLIALGIKYRAAVLGIHHVNKGSKGRTPGERVTGSGAWTQAPRLSLMVAPIDAGDDKVPDRWVFICEKTQGKGRGIGYEYTFEEEPKTEITRIAWGNRLEGSPQSILTEAEGTESDGSKVAIAMKFLRRLLADGKSVNVWEITRQCEDADIKPITLRRAKDLLKIETLRVGKSSYRWVLPENAEASRTP